MIAGYWFGLGIFLTAVVVGAIAGWRDHKRQQRELKSDAWPRSHVRVFDQDDPYPLSDDQVETLESWFAEEHPSPPRRWEEY